MLPMVTSPLLDIAVNVVVERSLLPVDTPVFAAGGYTGIASEIEGSSSRVGVRKSDVATCRGQSDGRSGDLAS